MNATKIANLMPPGGVPDIVVDAAEISLRQGFVRDAMRERALDTLLIFSTPARPFGVHYAANYDLIGECALLVVSQSKDPVLHICEDWDLARARSVSPIKDIRHTADLAALGGQMLRDPKTGAAGLEWVGAEFHSALCVAAGGKVASSSGLFEHAARLKTDVEKALIRQAALIADYGFEYGYNALTPGMCEYELAAEIEFAMRSTGAVDNFGLLSAGKHNRAIGLPTDKQVEPGDFLIFEITPARYGRNYSAQLCRTITMGPASALAKEKYSILEEALEAGLQAVKPGALACDIVIAQDDVITRYGYGDYCRPPYMRARGHGFGMGRIDLARDNRQVMEPGMSMIVHPNQYFPELGYLALGEMVIVTETGAERLCKLRPGIYERE